MKHVYFILNVGKTNYNRDKILKHANLSCFRRIRRILRNKLAG